MHCYAQPVGFSKQDVASIPLLSVRGACPAAIRYWFLVRHCPAGNCCSKSRRTATTTVVPKLECSSIFSVAAYQVPWGTFKCSSTHFAFNGSIYIRVRTYLLLQTYHIYIVRVLLYYCSVVDLHGTAVIREMCLVLVTESSSSKAVRSTRPSLNTGK